MAPRNVLKPQGSEPQFSAFSARYFFKKSISIECKMTCIFSAYQPINDKCYTGHISVKFSEIVFPVFCLSRLLSNPERLLRKSHFKGGSFEPLEPRLLKVPGKHTCV